jgi:hypothetical protein
MNITAFRDIAPCSLIEANRRFSGAYCLHYQSDIRIDINLTDYTYSNGKMLLQHKLQLNVPINHLKPKLV